MSAHFALPPGDSGAAAGAAVAPRLSAVAGASLAQVERPRRNAVQADRSAAPERGPRTMSFRGSSTSSRRRSRISARRSTTAPSPWAGSTTPRPRARRSRSCAAHVAALLGAVADNGTVFELGNKALKRAEDKLKALEQETRYKPEDRQYLIERWRELKTGTEGAIRELERARKDFADLLRTLQTNEDFIDELLQVREHEKALEVIHKLTDGIKDASDKLKKLLTTLKSPGA